MKQTRSLRAAAIVIAASLVMAACGQKPGVHVDDGAVTAEAGEVGDEVIANDGLVTLDGAGETEPVADGATTPPPDGTTPAPSGGTTPAPSGGTRPAPSTGGTNPQPAKPAAPTQPSAQPQPAGGGQPAPTQTKAPAEPAASPAPAAGTRAPSGSDRTGVSDATIRIAVHAPVSGAAPLPSQSFNAAKDTYWLWQQQNGVKVLGRDVEVEFADDQYKPENARQVCRQLAATSFSVTGGGGTDQIQACGQLAGVSSFPYFSAGVTETGLEGNPWYFANSMTYRQQGVLLAQYLSKNFPGQSVAMVRTDTQNFADAQAGFEAGVQQFGVDYIGTEKHAKGDTTWYSAIGSKLSGQADIIYILSSPVDYIRFAQQNSESGYGPFQYVGVGVSMGLNAVLNSGCPQVDGGIFFSPFPGLDKIDEIDPEFKKAAAAIGHPSDDIALALWGFNQAQHELFKRYEGIFGTDLTREDYRAVVEAQGDLQTGVFPKASYSAQRHFGGTAVHVLQADCSTGQHRTLQTYASGF